MLRSPQLQLPVSRLFSIHAAEGLNVSWPIHELRPRYNLIVQGDVSTNALLMVDIRTFFGAKYVSLASNRLERLAIECFHSRGQHLCKFIGTKESVYIRKEFNSHRTGLGHKYGRHDVMWKHNIMSTTLIWSLRHASRSACHRLEAYATSIAICITKQN